MSQIAAVIVAVVEIRGCGGELLNLQDGGKPRRYRVPNTINAGVGERVLLCVLDGVLLRAALLSYGLPLLLIIVGAALAT